MNFSRYIVLALKGCAMGMADVVPGVSGGTIAFISGIYEELLDSIRSVNATALKLLLKLRLGEFWRHINGSFLLPVLLGHRHCDLFAGSPDDLSADLPPHRHLVVLLRADHRLGAARRPANRTLGLAEPPRVRRRGRRGLVDHRRHARRNPQRLVVRDAFGAIAICAMILPGISGAFILLLLGKYQYIMQAVGDLNIPVIVIFVVGAAAGIISFSHLLSWLLKHWHDVTVAVLMGFMVGSLNKVWPWKETAETYLDSHGVAQPLVQHNVAPGTFEQLTGQPSQLVQAVLALRRRISGHLRHRTAGAYHRQKRGEVTHATLRTDRTPAGAFGFGRLLHGKVQQRGDKRL